MQVRRGMPGRFAAFVASIVLAACQVEPFEPAARDSGWEGAVWQSAVVPASAARGELVGTATPTTLSISQELYRIDVFAEGVITGIGRVQAQWSLPQVILDLANGRGMALSNSWSAFITAANGDEIHGRYTLPGNTVPVTATGSFRVQAYLEMTGGTGRFANASGTGTSIVQGNVFTRRVRVDLEGELIRTAGN